MLRSGSTRRLAAALILLLALPAVPACSSCPPEAADLTAHPDYSSPAAAGRSFFAALGCDDARAEYGALGEALKRRHGATLDAWILARPAVREELGAAVRFAHRLQPAREIAAEDGVLVWWSAVGAERVGLLFHSQHYVELQMDDGREVGFSLPHPPGAYLTLEGTQLLLALQAADAVLRGVDPARVSRVTLATEWKIADWMLPGPERAGS